MKKQFYIILGVLLFIASSCNKTKPNILFYHWKSDAKFNKSYKETFEITQTNTLYFHYFDLKLLNKNDWKNDGIYPVYLLRDVDSAFTKFNVVPVIYITNRVFRQKINIQGLVDRTTKLIHQISNKQFGREFTQIQIDCDWTQSTKNGYFEFLKLISENFEVGCTIRLHQIKFKSKTGIPPVKKGTLMLYNIGELKNMEENSILDNTIVKKYINSDTDYPLPLNLGLPIFSQTVIKNTANKIKLINHSERKVLERDNHFKKINNTQFTVVKDTLFKGFYLSKDYQLKLEEVSETEIISSYKTVINSNLNINDVIFYHLDQKALNNTDLKKIVNQL